MDRPTPCESIRDNLPDLLRILSGRWTLQVLCVLHEHGPIRFGELRRRLGSISTKTLTERVRLLEAEGLVSREYLATIPPRVTYAMTPRMNQLGPILEDLSRVAASWSAESRAVEGAGSETYDGAKAKAEGGSSRQDL